MTIIIHNASDLGTGQTGYWAEVVELPGCATQGQTFRELLHNLADAIEGWMDAVPESKA